MEQYKETLADLNRIIDHTPDNARAFARRGEIYHQTERYEEALVDFNRAIELNPGYAWALAHRGETYRQTKRYEEALVDFSRAIELKPNYAWALAHRGATHRQMRRRAEALADLNRAIELKSDYAWALIHRTETYVTMKRYQEALIDADRAIALNKTIVSHWRGERGLLTNYLGQYTETIASCALALQENPNDYIALYSLAVAEACWKDLAQAQATISRALAVLHAVIDSETQARVLYRLGGLMALRGNTDQALTYLQEAISLDEEPMEIARHDPAWFNLRSDPVFQSLIAETNVEWLAGYK